uniref:CopG family transcriptional regulator n=1 Tax=Candidatus Kentrum sp. UNK TaxID=2126344 RepID=A0A451B455_9GAMM|nr:MAG: hypothetical protein BECKUNK1418G_GA0071005_11963 [Candidatus Kentron sp. UNK]VFK73062.1 MAG: hypothetical protein BECKUNK1418H_GA0071006_11603 [Candidatus Kentron sp. UNK]
MQNVVAVAPKRSTIYFEPDLRKALRIKSAETSRSISNLVNDAVREALSEDAEDLAAFEKRATEPLISYEDMLLKLREDDRI